MFQINYPAFMHSSAFLPSPKKNLSFLFLNCIRSKFSFGEIVGDSILYTDELGKVITTITYIMARSNERNILLKMKLLYINLDNIYDN